ncbi:hypothetical protein [Paractinoplanes maris]|uniref:hypothetical protein n=1 Tax=Paractinoplanes maris TaxID=1734446 RepID=UPI0020208B4F|nr:hypothetical protein [Actinoplanes maris]
MTFSEQHFLRDDTIPGSLLAPAGPAGFWGMSMGAAIGLALMADDDRLTAGVLGLIGLRDNRAGTAARITAPIEFALQWDDELVPRSSGLALFETFASADKTLHANPGRHGGLPRHEADSAVLFFRRHLGPGESSAVTSGRQTDRGEA